MSIRPIVRALSALVPNGLSLFIAAVFIDSLRYKFTDHPKTEVIFSTLNDWAGTLGFPGLFAHGGLFSAYVIGGAELAASLLLIIGIIPFLHGWQGAGAFLSLTLMTGAISFHLFTPLGIDPNNDGGGLFLAACLVWASSLAVLYVRRGYMAKRLREPGTYGLREGI